MVPIPNGQFATNTVFPMSLYVRLIVSLGVLVVVYLVGKMGAQASRHKKTCTITLQEFPDLSVSDIPNYLNENAHKREYEVLAQESYAVRVEGNCGATQAVAHYNAGKDRYASPFTLDNSRVKLATKGDLPGDDYINASFISGPKSPVQYIAAQAPVPRAIADFWRMIWEQNVQTIIMLTQLEEKGRKKADLYWPLEASPDSECMFEGFVVVLDSESHLFGNEEIIERKMTLIHDKESRQVTQYHYIAWPDHGVPKSTSTIRQLAQHILSIEANSPTVIHCSAGVGRTGTLIGVLSLAEKVLKESGETKINLPQTVRQMRSERSAMVQSMLQYKFIYDVVLELANESLSVVVKHLLEENAI